MTGKHRHHRAVSHRTRMIAIGAIGAVLVLFGGLAASAVSSPTGATITSDQADYPPGALVTLTGAGWASGETVHIVVNDTIGQTWKLQSGQNGAAPDPVADGSGAFTYSFNLPNYFVSDYDVSATGPTSGTATTTFTDVSIGTYDQCSNDTGTGYTSGDTGCRWINGNLQSSNSLYNEGDATVQRAWLTGYAPGSTHTITFEYGTTKGGKHAYDFLTRWDWSENWITDADRCQGITGCTSVSDQAANIPVDPNAGGFDAAADTVQQRQFVVRGAANLGSVTTPALSSGSYSGDSETQITLTFTVPLSGPMCPTTGADAGTCSVAIWFGAHVASGANWGIGNGAGSISGSPYHVSLAKMDGAAVGQRDNQMQTSAIPLGTIVVVKDAVPNDAQDFTFDIAHSGSPTGHFSLDDDNNGTLPNSQTFVVPPGTYGVTETNIPASWTLTNLVCAVTKGNGGSTFTVAKPLATINLNDGDEVTCTYTDTKVTTTSTTTVIHSGDPATDINAAGVTSVALGSTVHDKATVTGSSPTGDVTFTWFTGGDCTTGTPHGAGTVSLVNGVAHPSTSFGPLAAGSYAFQATYNGDSNNAPSTGDCEPLTVDKANSSTVTVIHSGNPATDINAAGVTSVALGSTVHDKATVSGTGFGTPTGDVDFTFFTSSDCTTGGTAAGTGVSLVSGVAHPSSSEGPLAAGSYSFQATYNGDGNYKSSTGDCEPLTVRKAQLTIGTKIHDSNHNVIANGSVVPLTNNIVHDTAQVGGTVGTFTTGAVTFRFYTGPNCTNGTAIATAANPDAKTGDPRSIDTSSLPVGQYGFTASVASNSNYEGATSACEPFSVASIGKTMGYWGNKNGIARIEANGGYAANAVDIGRGAIIDTKAEALKILPNTLNACGKGSPIIFSDQTLTKACSVAKGVNVGSLNTLAAQTLALNYNIKILPSFTGQTLASLACTQYATAGLNGSSTVNQTLTVAIALINGSASGGTTTQAQIGAMNQLLGCVNREV